MDKELKIKLEGMFINNATISIKELNVAQEEKDYTKIAFIIHKLKGTTKLLNIEKLVTICEETEVNLKSENVKAVAEMLALFQVEFEEFKKSVTT